MEEKIINKPPFTLTLQLFIFMMIVMVKIEGLVSNLNGLWWDNIGQISLDHFIVSWLVDLLAYGYCIVSIYKALQGKPYSVAMLKFSSIYILIQLIFTALNNTVSIIPLLPFIFVPIIVICGIFIVYLYRSKKLRNFIPLETRTFGIYGCLGLAIYIMSVTCAMYFGLRPIIKRYKSLPVEVKEVSLQKGELTDGLIVFKPLPNWVTDTITSSFKDGYAYYYNDEEDNEIMVSSFMQESCNNRVDYNAIVASLYKIIKDNSTIKGEVAYADSIINDAQFYSNTYEIIDYKGEHKYWTVSALVPKNFCKMTLVSYFQKDGYNKSISESKAFMNGISFDLKQ